jgi:hypothetical protein
MASEARNAAGEACRMSRPAFAVFGGRRPSRDRLDTELSRPKGLAATAAPERLSPGIESIIPGDSNIAERLPVSGFRSRVHVRTLPRMNRERMTVSLDGSTAARVRQCGARTRGGASAYLERLVRQDAVREAAEQHARWFAQYPTYFEDAEAEAEAARSADTA